MAIIYIVSFEFKLNANIRYLFYTTPYIPFLLAISTVLLYWTTFSELLLIAFVATAYYTATSFTTHDITTQVLIDKSSNFALIANAIKCDVKYRVVNSSSLDVNKQYIFALHPLSVWTLSPNIVANSNLLNFHTFFMIDKIFFHIPFVREMCKYFHFMPLNDVQQVLDNKYSVVIAPDISGEYMHETINISNRTGIFNLAIKNRMSIVPIINYNESDLYAACLLGNVRAWLKSFGINPLLIRFNWNYDKGIIPNVTEIELAIGKPVFNEDILKFKSEYVDELKRMRRSHPPSNSMRRFDVK
jgi:hypothetical protein